MKKTLELALLLVLAVCAGCGRKEYTITVLSDNPACYVSGGGRYEEGTSVTISATAISPYTFEEWDDGVMSNPRVIEVYGDATYIAYFGEHGSSGGGSVGSSITAPTGVSASIDEDGDLYISWNRVSNASTYNVYYSTSSSGTYSYVKSTSYTYAWIISPTSAYNYVKISAVDGNGNESPLSSYAYAYCSSCGSGGGGGGGVSVPSAPTGVTATGTGTSSSPQVRISWSSVSGATSYKVYRGSSSSGTYSQVGSSTTNTYLYDNSPLSGYNYYKVKAVNSAGESSYSSYAYYNNSNSGGGGGGSTSYSPCPPTVTVSGTSSNSVSWTVSTSSGCGTPTKYEVYHYDPCGENWDLLTTTTSRSYSVSSSNVHPGINKYIVKAINSEGSASSAMAVSSSIPLAKPSSFSASKSGDYVSFSWSRVDKATGYQIFSSTSSSGTYYIFDEVTSGSTTTHSSYYPASSGTTVYFKIKAKYSCDYVTEYSDLTTYTSVRF